MSYEEPVVISTSFLVVSSLRSFMGLGVVVTTHLGLEPEPETEREVVPGESGVLP